MKKLRLSLAPLALVLGTIFLFTSCRKVNEATTLGDDLIPEVDNVSTFEKFFKTQTNNGLLADTSRLAFSDNAALGNITNDPEFGKTNAGIYFSISSNVYGTDPFISNTNLRIDSVVLSLSFKGSFGDTLMPQTVRVFEIDPTSDFTDTTFYKFTHSEFGTTGTELGSRTFAINTLNDSIFIKDTVKSANVLRIRLSNTLGQRFAAYDATATANGGFYNDSLFKKLFKGLAIKADEGTGNGLAYFDLSDASKTNMTVYYKATINNVADSAGTVVFTHSRNGQANIIKRTPAGNYALYTGNGPTEDDKLYIQTTPGSFAAIKIPALDTFGNNVIHRAELIVNRIATPSDVTFTAPNRLFLDKITTGDSAFILQNDVSFASDGTPDLTNFGGTLRSDNTYRFNITRHVQGIVSRKDPNNVLRLYAPLETAPYAFNSSTRLAERLSSFLVVPQVANGRVIVAGGNYADPSLQMRVRIVYSKL